MSTSLPDRLAAQQFANGYALVDGVEMHEQNGDSFQIPHPVLKKYLCVGHFVELRIDSPRFSVHEDAAVQCTCPSCNGEATNPILRHNHPATLQPVPDLPVPSRGWGEDFWVQITERNTEQFAGRVDNRLHETRLHGVHEDDSIVFHQNHILAVHPSHRRELVTGMEPADVKELAAWLASMQRNDS